MGCCFSEQCEEGDVDEARAPLLAQHSPSKSASHYSSLTQLEAGVADLHLQPLVMKDVAVKTVNKRLRDHAQLFNDHLGRRNTLLDIVRELQNSYPAENAQHTLYGCFLVIRDACKECSSVTVSRQHRYCMEIEYDAKEVAYNVIPALLQFNRANKLVKELLDKGQPLVNSIKLVLNGERELKRDILVASLGADGPVFMKNFTSNIAELQKVPEVVEMIRVETLETFEQLKNAVQVLLNRD